MSEASPLTGLVPHAGDFLPQYEAARTRAALFDLSDHAKVQLTGPDARTFLHNLCTNDVANLQLGQGCEAFLTTNKARVIAHIFVSCFEEHGETMLRLDSVPGSAEAILKHLNHYLISERVELTERTRDLAMFHICGPGANSIIKTICDLPDSLPHLNHVACSTEGKPFYVRRNDRLALDGFDLICVNEIAMSLWETLAKQAAPAGAEAFEILRIEAGVPVFGKDMDENRFVMEIGRTAQAISFKKGCFLGQEPIVMARDRGHVNRSLAGIKVSGSEPVARGARLLRDGSEVGEVTSSTISPKLGAPIALAYLRRGHQDPGTALKLDDGRDAVVLSLPIV